ncbi:GNAT family N-acetyltransferase [Alicyclobacillus curvatus]|nr:GNAT family N-acetyltransferase [Alicyclobacillus curvatus]
MLTTVTLREVQERDLPIFFEHQKDSIANHMAAFTSKDPTDWNLFSEHWSRILADEANVNRCILLGNHVVGQISSFEMFGEREVSYWIDRAHWSKGIATEALKQFLSVVTVRPLYGRAAKDNIGSRRVLEKCGFVITDEGSGYANARGMEIEEFIFTLRN